MKPRRPKVRTQVEDLRLALESLRRDKERLQALLENRAETEKAKLEARLQQVQKMESVGRLAGGVAHDLNNILTAVAGYSDFLLNEIPPEDPKRSDVEEIKRAVERATSLTRQLLAVSRQQQVLPQIVDLNVIVVNMVRLLRRTIAEELEIFLVLAQDLAKIKADQGQLEQVLLNLVVNARDAMPQGGKITIETANVELGEDDGRTHRDVRPGPYVMLAVRDTGTGMDPATLSRLFEPFFTTKEPGKGTGLGLATVYGIVQQSGGGVEVSSAPGQGSFFKVYMPAVRAEASSPATTAEAPCGARPAGSETILLVEDDEMVRKFVSRLLTQNGYTLMEARDPSEALWVCERHRGPIHLLLTDIVLPEMRGNELAQRLCAQRPGLKVLFTSGYADPGLVPQDSPEDDVFFIKKPLDSSTLTRKVREILDRGP